MEEKKLTPIYIGRNDKHNWVHRNAINTLLDYYFNNTGTYLRCRKLV